MRQLYTITPLANKQAAAGYCPICMVSLEFCGQVEMPNGRTWKLYDCKCPTPIVIEVEDRDTTPLIGNTVAGRYKIIEEVKR